MRDLVKLHQGKGKIPVLKCFKVEDSKVSSKHIGSLSVYQSIAFALTNMWPVTEIQHLIENGDAFISGNPPWLG